MDTKSEILQKPKRVQSFRSLFKNFIFPEKAPPSSITNDVKDDFEVRGELSEIQVMNEITKRFESRPRLNTAGSFSLMSMDPERLTALRNVLSSALEKPNMQQGREEIAKNLQGILDIPKLKKRTQAVSVASSEPAITTDQGMDSESTETEKSTTNDSLKDFPATPTHNEPITKATETSKMDSIAQTEVNVMYTRKARTDVGVGSDSDTASEMSFEQLIIPDQTAENPTETITSFTKQTRVTHADDENQHLLEIARDDSRRWERQARATLTSLESLQQKHEKTVENLRELYAHFRETQSINKQLQAERDEMRHTQIKLQTEMMNERDTRRHLAEIQSKLDQHLLSLPQTVSESLDQRLANFRHDLDSKHDEQMGFLRKLRSNFATEITEKMNDFGQDFSRAQESLNRGRSQDRQSLDRLEEKVEAIASSCAHIVQAHHRLKDDFMKSRTNLETTFTEALRTAVIDLEASSTRNQDAILSVIKRGQKSKPDSDQNVTRTLEEIRLSIETLKKNLRSLKKSRQPKFRKKSRHAHSSAPAKIPPQVHLTNLFKEELDPSLSVEEQLERLASERKILEEYLNKWPHHRH
ncbi:unnamed protein product [Notodromas monacha]|uniref:Uncharacterized protein n=1 Tax=Notodromas monacha TaxID=399045 RepID=A0A7R9BF31_9CRUS|nr:unnamed protein product [Notodromas monacha]CAG0913648.1 unnamed protein product [Notodromas monacha]